MKKRLTKKIKKYIYNLFKQNKGAVAILTGLTITASIGLAALALDVGYWYIQKQTLQNTADAGAVGGAFALSTLVTPTPALITSYAAHDINLNGCPGCTISVFNPPTSGAYVGDSKSVQVTLTQPATRYLSGLFLGTAPTVGARAVAQVPNATNCLIALTSTGTGLSLQSSAQINAPNCNVYVNSSDVKAITSTGGTSITSQKTSVVGQSSGGGTFSPAPTTGVAPIADPYLSFTPPTFSGCTQTSLSISSSRTLNPGVYCNGINVTGGSTVVTMNPGVYFIDRGIFRVSGPTAPTINGNGVTIILTSSTGANYATVNFASGVKANLTPPSTGTTAGVLFFADRNSPSSNTNILIGGNNQLLNGALYFPSTTLRYSGSSTTTSCLEIVAASIEARGQVVLNNKCGSSVLGKIKLVE